MTPEQYQRIKQIFQHVCDLEPTARQEYIDQACSNDDEIRSEVNDLLEHHAPEQSIKEGSRSSSSRRSLRPAQLTGSGSEMPTVKQPTKRRTLLPQPRGGSSGDRSDRTKWIAMLSMWLITVTIVGFWMYRNIADRLTETQTGELNTIANATAEIGYQWSNEDLQRVTRFADSASVRESVAGLQETDKNPGATELNREKLQALLKEFGQEIGLCEVYLRNGERLASSSLDRPTADRLDNSLMPYLLQSISSHTSGIHISNFPSIANNEQSDGSKISPEIVQYSVVVFAPVTIAGEKDGAALMVKDDKFLIGLREVLKKLQFGRSGDVYFFSRDGHTLSRPRHLSALVHKGWILSDPSDDLRMRLVDPGVDLRNGSPSRERNALPLTEAVALATSGNNGIGFAAYRNYAGVPVIGAWRWLPELQVGLVVEMDKREAYSSLWSVQEGFAALLLLFFATVLGVIWWGRARDKIGTSAMRTVGAYELLAPIATGGMGAVFRARHSLLKRPTAVKLIRGDRLSPDDVARFDREVRVAAKLKSPHTISIFDYGQTKEGQWYFSMELLDGLTLDKVVARYGPIPPHRVVHIIQQVCESLHEAHQQGMIHRDIKPQNIMLTQRGMSPDFVVVFDFGLAKPTQQDASLFMTDERVWVGTPMYMSPERIRDPRIADARCDVYAIGVLMYFLLVGNEPFSAADPTALFEQVLTVTTPPPSRDAKFPIPEALDRLVGACMEKSIENRPASAEQLRSSLEEIAKLIPWDRAESIRWWKSMEQS